MSADMVHLVRDGLGLEDIYTALDVNNIVFHLLLLLFPAAISCCNLLLSIMKLFLVASVSALLTTVLSASIPKEDIISLDTEILSSEDPMMISWPESANPNRRTSSYGPSNAERMQR